MSDTAPSKSRLSERSFDECYRMLGAYTTAFGSCHPLRQVFADAGFEVEVRSHFHGCATSLIGRKPGP